ARDRPRCGGDRAAAVHRRRRERDRLQLQRPHELAAGADLPERRTGAGPLGPDRLGRGLDAGRDDPHADPARTSDPEKEPSVVSDPAPNALRRDVSPDPIPSPEQPITASRPVPRGGGAAAPERVARAVTVERLNAWYGEHHSIKDLTLSFAPNKATALIGPSGSGKSTVVRCINRMHEEIPGARAVACCWTTSTSPTPASTSSPCAARSGWSSRSRTRFRRCRSSTTSPPACGS